jgi:hypothetical protein
MSLKPSRERFFANPRPADWILPMTVCIAAKCGDDGIVAMCDMMVSTGEFSADNLALKFRDLHRDWNAMFAGNDVSRIVPLITKAKLMLRGSETRSMAEAEATMRQCFHEELVQKQTDLVLARYGMDMESFLDTGLTRFGETTFTSIKYQIDQIDLGCSFLVFGYDGQGTACLYCGRSWHCLQS